MTRLSPNFNVNKHWGELARPLKRIAEMREGYHRVFDDGLADVRTAKDRLITWLEATDEDAQGELNRQLGKGMVIGDLSAGLSKEVLDFERVSGGLFGFTPKEVGNWVDRCRKNGGTLEASVTSVTGLVNYIQTGHNEIEATAATLPVTWWRGRRQRFNLIHMCDQLVFSVGILIVDVGARPAFRTSRYIFESVSQEARPS